MHITFVLDFLCVIEQNGGVKIVPCATDMAVLEIHDLTHMSWEKIGLVQKDVYESACRSGYLNTVGKKRGYLEHHECIRVSTAGCKLIKLTEDKKKKSKAVTNVRGQLVAATPK